MMRTHNNDLDASGNDESLQTADAVARAAHIWIHSLCLNERQEPGERHTLAAGLIAGLCERLSLDPRVKQLVAYVFTLLDNEGGQALAVSRMLADHPAPLTNHNAYARGRSEAVGIVEMLAYHGNKKQGPQPGA